MNSDTRGNAGGRLPAAMSGRVTRLPRNRLAGLFWGIVAALLIWTGVILSAVQDYDAAPPLPSIETPLRKALLLLRSGKTAEARAELNRLVQQDPSNAEIHYQIARSHLMDFYQSHDPAKSHISVGLAMEALESALRLNPDLVPALQAKSMIHARSELLYYDPNLAYELSARVARLQPYANEYLLKLAQWLSGEVRFTVEGGHRVPHDPAVGLDRAIEIIDRVVDTAVPFSPEEVTALFLLGKTLARRGNYAEAAEYYRMVLDRHVVGQGPWLTLRELGVAQYRMGHYDEAARTFYRIVQGYPNPVDQWLLKVALDEAKTPPFRVLPALAFPAAEVKVDPSNPPLLAFEDMAPELGVDRLNGNGTCAWGDYDGDGRLDLAVAGSGTFITLYRNEGSHFRDVTAEAGLAGVPSGYSLNFVDYDNDGWLDLYVSLNGWSGPMPNRLFRNLGNGRFQDVSKQSGLADPGSGFVSLWGDLDNDGYLDLVVANGVLKDGSVTQIYRNNRDGTFTNVTKQAGLDEPPSYGAIGIALGDYDRDGDLDLFINGLDPAPNRLYRNDGNFHFTEVAEKAGVRQPTHNGFVCFFLDYNNDAWPDLLTTSLAPWETVVEGLKRGYSVPNRERIDADSSRLFRNNGDGTFTDVTLEAKLFYPMGVMGAGVADLDNDGYLDLYFGVGDPELTRLEPNRFFHNNGDGTFSDLTYYVGFGRPGKKGHGVTFVDIDEDGDLDVYAQLGGHYLGDHARNVFYRNLKGNGNHWLEVDLTGVRSNRYAIGAALVLKAGDLTVYREVKGSEGFGSTDPYRVHFGLGRKTKIDSLEISWPSRTKQTFTNLDPDQIIQIREDRAGWRVKPPRK